MIPERVKVDVVWQLAAQQEQIDIHVAKQVGNPGDRGGQYLVQRLFQQTMTW